MNIKQFFLMSFLAFSTTSYSLSLSQSIVLANKQSQVNDYTKCFELVEQLGVDIAEIVADVATKNIPQIIIKAVETVKLTYEAIKCFENNTHSKRQSLMNFLDEDKRQCYLEHLQQAMGMVVEFTQDLGNGDTERAVQDFHKLVDVLRDAQKNC